MDTNLTIAYKCSSCGTFEFSNGSFFSMFMKKEHFFACKCGKSGIIICRDNNKGVKISLPCIACGEEHTFVLGRKDIFIKEANHFCCPKTGIPQFFMGNDIVVRREIDRLEQELDKLISTFGYENYFVNTQVMLDAVNKIHDVAEQGNLCCECGNKDIELVVFSDSIQLKCKKCWGASIIHAATNEDLKNILKKQYIHLLVNRNEYMLETIREYL